MAASTREVTVSRGAADGRGEEEEGGTKLNSGAEGAPTGVETESAERAAVDPDAYS